MISLQQPPNCSKLVVKGKKTQPCFKWKKCIPSAGACSILSLIIPRISPVHELPLKIIYRQIDMSVLSVLCMRTRTWMCAQGKGQETLLFQNLRNLSSVPLLSHEVDYWAEVKKSTAFGSGEFLPFSFIMWCAFLKWSLEFGITYNETL